MVVVCRKNWKHQPLGPTRCLVPGCNSLLIDRDDLPGMAAAPATETSPPSPVEPTPARTPGPVATPPVPTPELVDKPLVEPAPARTPDPVATAPALTGELVDTPPGSPPPPVETASTPAPDPKTETLRQEVAELVAHAEALAGEARTVAVDAVALARTALAAAAHAAAQAEPFLARLGFGEAARHAEGARYHAGKADAAANEAADHAANAGQAKAAVDALIAGLGGTPGAPELRALLGKLQPAVAAVERFAGAARDAFGRAASAAQEAGALQGFFAKALALWRGLHG